ncbi:MAG: HTH domain-containing protein [Clostridia bacterium]|nr:HTH domain-containing protein [Clostridia bacterium]
MSKVSNMLNMVQILKDENIHSIQSLAQKLEVSERMIRQYKQELEQA